MKTHSLIVVTSKLVNELIMDIDNDYCKMNNAS